MGGVACDAHANLLDCRIAAQDPPLTPPSQGGE